VFDGIAEKISGLAERFDHLPVCLVVLCGAAF
jgi:hypothetical protein